MLDLVAEAWAKDNGGADMWADRTVTFLDPFTKSGVFLREITKRLSNGLADEIPDLESEWTTSLPSRCTASASPS